ncbi:MAG: SDR family oxidoreductase [Gemmatimonadota bacterium]|nr:SDR family oxidoreductase [Gemmatimonadales bacterium]MDQ3136359.1 SDR family oxidoreductase [Gemmatimonadota bacterium]
MPSSPVRPYNKSQDVLVAAGAVLGLLAAARALSRRSRYIELRGRVVLVTGGSRGLGLVLARELVALGAKVAICARDEAELERARADLEARGGQIVALPCDITERRQVDAMLAQVRERLGAVEVLINNAGTIQVGPMEEMTPEDYEHALRVHFWGPLFTTLGVLPDMRRRRAGRIVNIASVGGKIAVPHLLPYSASKFALVGFSEGLRGGLARHGIRVTTVCPGLMRTGSPRNATFKGRHREEFAWFSIGDSLPGLSMEATRAARRILDACRHGDAELVMPLSTALAVKLNALAPGAGAAAMSLAERFLPKPGGIGTDTRRGSESESRWSPSVLTTLGDQAAARNNELVT